MALKPRVEEVNLDFCEDYTEAPIWAVQGTINSLQLKIQIYQDGEVVNLFNTDITFKARLSDGLIYETVVTESNDVVVELDRLMGNFTIVPEASMFAREGDFSCEVIVNDPVNGILAKTPAFAVHVLGAI